VNDILARRQLTLRLVPWPLLLIAVPFVLIAGLAWREGALSGPAWLLLAVPAVIVLLVDVTTVTVDQDMREVRLRRVRVWGARERSFSFDDVAAVAVEASQGSRSRTYGVVLALRSGEKVPLRSYTSSGRASKQRLARRLADAVNQGRSTPVAAAVDGVIRDSSAGTTDGVQWTLDRVDRGNGWELTRFHAPEPRLADGFLLIVPTSAKAAMPPLGGGGLMGSLLRVVVQQYLRAIDLTEADLPGLERAASLAHEQLARGGFAATTSAPEAARCWLDAGAAALLAGCAQATQASPALEPQLVLGPTGLRLLVRSCLRDEAELARLRQLGLALASSAAP
jgi:hypothetical protein